MKKLIKYRDLTDGFTAPQELINMLKGRIPSNFVDGDLFRVCKKALRDDNLYFRQHGDDEFVNEFVKAENAEGINDVRIVETVPFIPDEGVVIECFTEQDVEQTPETMLDILFEICSKIECDETQSIEFGQSEKWLVSGCFKSYTLHSLYSWHTQSHINKNNREIINSYIRGDYSKRGKLKGHVNNDVRHKCLLKDMERVRI